SSFTTARGARPIFRSARGGAMPALARYAAPLSLTLFLLPTSAGAAADPPAADASARARELLTAARQALGGESALAALHALSLEGELRRSLAGDDGPTEMSGSLRAPVLPPHHY